MLNERKGRQDVNRESVNYGMVNHSLEVLELLQGGMGRQCGFVVRSKGAELLVIVGAMLRLLGGLHEGQGRSKHSAAAAAMLKRVVGVYLVGLDGELKHRWRKGLDILE